MDRVRDLPPLIGDDNARNEPLALPDRGVRDARAAETGHLEMRQEIVSLQHVESRHQD